MSHQTLASQAVGESQFTVDTASADWTGVAKAQFLSWAMQEAAWRHAETIGFGTEQMKRDGVIWILSRQQTRIDRLPRWKDKVTVRTWYADREKLLFHRDFEIADCQGEVLVRATTAWIALDIARRRPVRTDKVSHSEPVDRARAVTDPWEPIPDLEDAQAGDPFRVMTRDLDMSAHANNINYPEWLLEPLDLGFRATHDLKALDIAFQAEAVHGVELQSHLLGQSDGRHRHHLRRTSDGKVICSGRSVWEPLASPRSVGWTL